jgi:hypothetical protein
LSARAAFLSDGRFGASFTARHWDGPGDPRDFVDSKNLNRRTAGT